MVCDMEIIFAHSCDEQKQIRIHFGGFAFIQNESNKNQKKKKERK